MSTQYGDQITPHLFRVAWREMSCPGGINCDVYAIDCGDQVALIDAGRGGPAYPIMKANLVHWDLRDRLSVCLLTHLHMDHAGGVEQLKEDGVQVWGSPGADAYRQDERAAAYFTRGQQPAPVPQLDRVLQDGERFWIGNTEFEALSTPGHTSACMTYFATIGSLRCAFTGDMVMPNGTIGYSGSFDFDQSRLLSSLERLVQRDFDALLTGHTFTSSQPEGFWLQDGKRHAEETLQAGREGKWVIQKAA